MAVCDLELCSEMGHLRLSKDALNKFQADKGSTRKTAKLIRSPPSYAVQNCIDYDCARKGWVLCKNNAWFVTVFRY